MNLLLRKFNQEIFEPKFANKTCLTVLYIFCSYLHQTKFLLQNSKAVQNMRQVASGKTTFEIVKKWRFSEPGLKFQFYLCSVTLSFYCENKNSWIKQWVLCFCFVLVIFIFVFSNIGAAFKADVSSWVSLTYPLSEKTPVYPGVYDPLRINPEKSAATDEWPGIPAADGTYVAFRFIEMYEHTGTHVDAPSHFCKGCKDEADLTWEELTGPLVIINVREIVRNVSYDSFFYF